jgi:hypothetical protein
MLNKIRKACAWVMEKAQTTQAWIRGNWPLVQEKTREIFLKAYKALMGLHRRAFASFNRGRAIAILTVKYRQAGNLAYRPAFKQAKSEVQAMSDAEVAYFVVDFFGQPDEAWAA